MGCWHELGPTCNLTYISCTLLLDCSIHIFLLSSHLCLDRLVLVKFEASPALSGSIEINITTTCMYTCICIRKMTIQEHSAVDHRRHFTGNSLTSD